jgi:prepilin-type N-terminal cleavage/methylation domain-containing protein
MNHTDTTLPRVTANPSGPADDGFTLVEILVAIGLFLLLMGIVMTTVLSISRATTNSKQLTNMNEQARIATERLSREMRQATEIRAAELPSTPGGDTSVTFGVDFNGNSIIEGATLDPEIITYRYDSSGEQLTLTANDESGTSVTRPILSEEVTDFEFNFRSSLWQYDTNADGITTWEELDAAPGIGNQNGVLDAPELRRVDLVAVTLTVMDGDHTQTYQTQVGLRNQSQN